MESILIALLSLSLGIQLGYLLHEYWQFKRMSSTLRKMKDEFERETLSPIQIEKK